MKYAKHISLAVGTVVLLCSPSTVLAVENGGVGGRPARPRDDNPRSKSIFVHELSGGSNVGDAVALVNNTAEKQVVEVYATDAQIASGGAFSCEQKADKVDQEGAWIKLEESSVELEPATEKVVDFTISVPEDASVGEHNACIAIQAIKPANESAANGVQLSFRSAIRVAVTVPGEITKQLSYDSLQVNTNRDKLVVTERLRNSGNVSLDTKLKTTVNTFLGFGEQVIEGEYPIISGQLAEFNFEFKRPFWGGFYSVKGEATYNSDPKALLGDIGDKQETVSTSRAVFVVPNPFAILIYALVLIFIVLPFIRKRINSKRLSDLEALAIKHTVRDNDNIKIVADQYGADWRQIAMLNSLEPPYTLTSGQKILVVPAADQPAKIKKSKLSRVKVPRRKKAKQR